MKNNASNPIGTIMAFFTLGVIWRAAKRMIKKYHKKQELFY